MKTRLLFLCLALTVVLTACGGETPQQQAASTAVAAPLQQPMGGSPETGKQLVENYACGACHRIPGVEGAQGSLGPSLAGVGSRTAMTTGIPINQETMVAYLQNPPAVDPQTRMPPLGVTDEEARHISAYLFTLK